MSAGLMNGRGLCGFGVGEVGSLPGIGEIPERLLFLGGAWSWEGEGDGLNESGAGT